LRAPLHAVPLGQGVKTSSQQASPSAPHGAQMSPSPQPIPVCAQTLGVPGCPSQQGWPDPPQAMQWKLPGSNWQSAPGPVHAVEQQACPIAPHPPHDPAWHAPPA
jgi:hypothetical protein